LNAFLVVLIASVEGCGCENEDIHPGPEAGNVSNPNARTDAQSEFANFKGPGKGEREQGAPEFCKRDPTRLEGSIAKKRPCQLGS